jgi:L-ornithine Nalpha-acyltransferase
MAFRPLPTRPIRASGRPTVSRLNPFAVPGVAKAGSRSTIPLFPGLRPLPRRLPDQGGLDPVLGRLGSLEVRLATTKKEIKKAQRLRYRVFFGELSAMPNAATMLSRRDMDAYDAICDHLLVLDHNAVRKSFGQAKPKVVGCYRLLRQEVADRHFGFYTAGEFDIQQLVDSKPGLRFLELGRSCVLKPYRNKRTVELLWRGIWTYVQHHRVDAMIGCASLEGTDPERLALPLSFLHHHAWPAEGWHAAALPARYVSMNRLPKEAIDLKAAMQALPPLIKGYLRLGASFGEGAVIDRQFGTTDVLVILPVSAISQRYAEHYRQTTNRRAA